MKVSTNFWLREFIDPETYKQYGDNSIWFIDERIITITQKLRDRLSISLFVNTWHIGGDKMYSGYRFPHCSIGANKSQHKFGRGDDVKTDPNGSNDGADKIRDEITANFELYNKLGLTTIESAEFAPTWCHLDIRWTHIKELFIIKP